MTRDTCWTSMPRANKSVVMRTRLDPERNSRMITSRWLWSMSPCCNTQVSHHFCHWMSTDVTRHPCHLEEKTPELYSDRWEKKAVFFVVENTSIRWKHMLYLRRQKVKCSQGNVITSQGNVINVWYQNSSLLGANINNASSLRVISRMLNALH